MTDFFHITYKLILEDGDDPEERIRSLQLEQSAELPGSVVASIGMQHVTGEVIHRVDGGSGDSGSEGGGGQDGGGEQAGGGGQAGGRQAGGSGLDGGGHAGGGGQAGGRQAGGDGQAGGVQAGGSDGLSGGDPIDVNEVDASTRERTIEVTIAWPQQNHGSEITQFLNVLFGNISLKQGIVITDIRWGDVSPALFRGPSFGIRRIRKLWDIPERPLSCTALKPMGYSSTQLAGLAYELAVGGMDIIKDDHGLANQPSAPFEERVKHCVAAMERAADKSGRRSRYFPNITADPFLAVDRYKMACEMGADGVLFSPMLSGPAVMHHLAHLASSDSGIPIMAHPAFSGRYIADDSGKRCGFAAGLFYGGLLRALGADFVIYPNYGGRFSYSQEACHDINRQARSAEAPFPKAFPTPGGGMQLDRMSHWLRTYGKDTTFLMGGSLYEDRRGLEAAAREFADVLSGTS